MRRGTGGGNRSAPPREELIGELERAGARHTPEDIVRIERDPNGRVIFLEKGNPESGLEHTMQRHAEDFAKVGISQAEIPDAVMAAVTRGQKVGVQGATRSIYEVEFNGRLQRIAVEVGDNGYVVSANPNSK